MLTDKPPDILAGPPVADVLIVDDDHVTLETFERMLTLEGFSVVCSTTGTMGVRLAAGTVFDTIFVDLHLVDMPGTDVISALRRVSTAELVLVSGFLTVEVVVEAMRRGASDAVEKPLDRDALLRIVRRGQHRTAAAQPGSMSSEALRRRLITAPQSVVERWVGYVVRAWDAAGSEYSGDFRTLENWARRAGVSCSTLCETCRLLSFRPLDARDFVRILSSLRLAIAHNCAPEVLLNVSSRRVLRALSSRAGVDLANVADSRVLDRFFHTQQIISPNSEALRLIRRCSSMSNESA